MNTGTGVTITIVVGFILGDLLAILIKKNIWVAVGLMGGIAGCFLGQYIYVLIVASTPHEENWEVIALCFVFFVIGAIISFKWGREIVALSTSFIGSYLIMRGFTLIFGCYPDEGKVWSDISEGKEITVEQSFWSTATFGLCSLCCHLPFNARIRTIMRI